MEVNVDYVNKYGRWLDKKLKGVPAPMQTLQRRTMNTATTILSTIEGIPFSELSYNLYFFCKDVDIKFFTRQYEAQLELAGADEERFAKGLHKFYNDMTRTIKEKNLYQAFFEFVSACAQIRYSTQIPKTETATKVIDSYQSLLLQQMEYLRPDKFDFTKIVCGRTTDGELMTMPDSYPNFDAPAVELERDIREGRMPATQAELNKRIAVLYARYGYPQVKTLTDVDLISNEDRVFTHHQCGLIPYINEFTFDMMPDPVHPFSALALPLYNLRCDDRAGFLEELQGSLRHRSRTLPSNGVVINLKDDKNILLEEKQTYRSIKMKEMLYDDSVIMLYKAETVSGQLCGYYNTQNGFFFSVLQEAKDQRLYERFRLMVLYLYATQVTRKGPEMLAEFQDHFWYVFEHEEYGSKKGSPFVDIDVQVYGRGGKPENTYRPDHVKTGTRAGNEAYESEQRAIQGYIRKVGAGRTPSEEAVARGRALGYDLAPDETYVQPFIKTVLKLKAKEPTQTKG